MEDDGFNEKQGYLGGDVDIRVMPAGLKAAVAIRTLEDPNQKGLKGTRSNQP